MKLVKAIVRPNKVDQVKDALGKLGVEGITVTEVRGHGKQKGHPRFTAAGYHVSCPTFPTSWWAMRWSRRSEGGRQRARTGDRRRPRIRAFGRRELPHPVPASGYTTDARRSIAGGDYRQHED